MHTLKHGATPESDSKQPASAATPGPVSAPFAALGYRLGNAGLRVRLQAKLTVSSPRDAFEQEADRVADQVMRMPDSQSVMRTPLQIQRVCDKCEEELHRSEDSPSSVPDIDPATEHSIASLSSRGSPLPGSVLSFMEPRFNADFSAVRVHTGAQAQSLAGSVNAKAFTVGQDVVFGAGHYAPETDDGKRLLAHELTHVIQQRGPGHRLARKPSAHASDAFPPDKPMSAKEAREVLLADLAQAGLSDSLAAMAVIQSTLARPDTARNFAPRLRRLTAAFSLLDQEGAKSVLKALNTPVGDGQHVLQARFNHLDGRSRKSLLAILHAQVARASDPEAAAGGDPRADGRHRFTPKWLEVHPGVFALVAEPGMTLRAIGAYLSGNPQISEALAELNGLDSNSLLTKTQPIVVPIEFIDRPNATGDMPEKVRRNMGARLQAMADHAAWNRFVKVRTSGDKYLQKLADFEQACRMSGPYIPNAVASRVGQVAEGLLSGLLDFALDAVKILAISTAVGALIGGLVGAGVGAIPGAEVGFEIGLLILEVYGLAMLVQSVLGIAGTLVSQLGTFFRLFWTANANEERLDLAAHALAEAIGTLAAAVLIAVFAYLLKKGGDALRNTRFARKLGQKALTEWFKQRQRLLGAGTETPGLGDGLSDPKELGIENLPEDTGPDAPHPDANEPDVVPDEVVIDIPGEGEEITQTDIDPFGSPEEVTEDIDVPGPDPEGNGPEPDGNGSEPSASALRPDAGAPRSRPRPIRVRTPRVSSVGPDGKRVRVDGFGRSPAPPKPASNKTLKVGGFARESERVTPPATPPKPARTKTLRVGGFARASERVTPQEPSLSPRVDGFGRSPAASLRPRKITERLGEYVLHTSKRLSQRVLFRKIGAVIRNRRVITEKDIGPLLDHLVADARAAGANRLVFSIRLFGTADFASLKQLVELLGGTARAIDATHVQVDMRIP